jgi:hypothetical protein
MVIMEVHSRTQKAIYGRGRKLWHKGSEQRVTPVRTCTRLWQFPRHSDSYLSPSCSISLHDPPHDVPNMFLLLTCYVDESAYCTCFGRRCALTDERSHTCFPATVMADIYSAHFDVKLPVFSSGRAGLRYWESNEVRG